MGSRNCDYFFTQHVSSCHVLSLVFNTGKHKNEQATQTSLPSWTHSLQISALSGCFTGVDTSVALWPPYALGLRLEPCFYFVSQQWKVDWGTCKFARYTCVCVSWYCNCCYLPHPHVLILSCLIWMIRIFTIHVSDKELSSKMHK